MSLSRMQESLLPNMVAGKGFEQNDPLEFNEADFDSWLLFMKTHLGRYGGAGLSHYSSG